MSGDSRKIHITRKGEQFGPYPEETARKFLNDGQLKVTDLAWHDGADGWKPLPEVLGIAAAPDAPPPPPGPGAPSPKPAAPAGQPAGPITYSPHEEEDIKSTNLMHIGILLIVGAIFPIIVRKLSGDGASLGIEFPNFKFSGAKFTQVVAMLWPLIVGITAVSMAKTTKDPVRCGVVLGLSTLCFLIGADHNGAITQVANGMGTMDLFVPGWLCLVMGCRTRHMRPANLPAYILTLVGAGFLILFWLAPGKGGGVPLVNVFKLFGHSTFLAISILLLMGMQIAGGVICCMNTWKKPANQVASLMMLSLKLVTGSFVVFLALKLLHDVYAAFKVNEVDFSSSTQLIIVSLVKTIKQTALMLGMLLVFPFTASDLLMRLMRR